MRWRRRRCCARALALFVASDVRTLLCIRQWRQWHVCRFESWVVSWMTGVLACSHFAALAVQLETTEEGAGDHTAADDRGRGKVCISETAIGKTFFELHSSENSLRGAMETLQGLTCTRMSSVLQYVACNLMILLEIWLFFGILLTLRCLRVDSVCILS